MQRRYSRTDFYNGKFYQLGKEIFKGDYKRMSNNERVVYSVLKDRFELSIVNGWVDENNDIFFYFDQNQLAEECCISRSTVQRSINILVEYALVESVRQGVNLPNRLYLLKPNLQKIDTSNLDKVRMCQNDASGCVKMMHFDASKRSTNYTEYNNTEYKSSSMADLEKMEEEKLSYEFEYISYDGSVEKIKGEEDVITYIDNKTNYEGTELSSKLCMNVRNILYQIFNPFDTKNIKQFKVDGKVIMLDITIKKKLYQNISLPSFVVLVGAIQDNPEPIMSLKAFILACLYNYTSANRGRAAPRNEFNKFMRSENLYDLAELENDLLCR